MKYSMLLLLAVVLAFAPQTVSFGQYSRGTEMLSTRDLRRMGLERDWFAQVQVSRLRGGLTHLTQHVSATKAETMYEVKYEEGIDRYSELELDAFGKPIGKVAAKNKADARSNVLKADGLKPTITERVVPQVMLYATSSRGTLHALDGLTGATRWVVPLGNPEYPTEAPGANDSYVAAINGTHVMLFDETDGRQIWRRQTAGIPGAGPAVNDTYVFAPMTNGAVEAYAIDKERDPPNIYLSAGRAIYQPVATNDSVSWSTDRGHLYVGRASAKGVRFRLETQRQVSATPTILPNQKVIDASLDGYVYQLHEISGDILWRYSTGDAIELPPQVIGDGVYAITTTNGMYKLNLADGERVWWTPGIARFLAASKTRIYCESTRNELVAIDIASGGRLGSIPMGHQTIMLANALTDRIYLGSADGLVQCIREDLPEYEVPYYHRGVGAEGKQRQELIRDDAPAEVPAEAPDQPVPAGANPFAPPAGGDDPFAPKPAAAANPFAAPPAAGDNPFGADPFGGN